MTLYIRKAVMYDKCPRSIDIGRTSNFFTLSFIDLTCQV